MDVLSWDFGMTDGNEDFKMYEYFLRNGAHPNRPASVGIYTGRTQANILGELEAMGLIAFTYGTVADQSREHLPDCSVLTEDEIAELPPFIRNFKCGHEFEAGEPYCAGYKFNYSVCPDRKYMVSWHPGWYVQFVPEFDFDGSDHYFLLYTVLSLQEAPRVNRSFYGSVYGRCIG
jgi:hypothetical protein